jgi:hypothetical protein
LLAGTGYPPCTNPVLGPNCRFWGIFYIFTAMRGTSSQPYLTTSASGQFPDSRATFLVCIFLFSAIFSGCASVSAENAVAKPVAAKISVVPSVIDFKAVVVGQKNSQSVNITNSTSNSINLKGLQVSGVGFSLSSAKSGVLLSPGGHVNLSVDFAPASAAGQTGALVISRSPVREKKQLLASPFLPAH